MSLHENQELMLIDGEGKPLGRVRIREVRQNLVLGDFSALAEFDCVAGLFAEFVEAANEQCLSVIDDLDRKIASMRLRLDAVDGSTVPEVFDVQVGEGSINFRIREPVAATATAPLTSSSFEQADRQSVR